MGMTGEVSRGEGIRSLNTSSFLGLSAYVGKVVEGNPLMPLTNFRIQHPMGPYSFEEENENIVGLEASVRDNSISMNLHTSKVVTTSLGPLKVALDTSMIAASRDQSVETDPCLISGSQPLVLTVGTN
ncbi:hypothetical protein Q3G72_009349 [Acer saccharum]|nr:hypothetical protein Q3G72_009349 [Acer saccharum]